MEYFFIYNDCTLFLYPSNGLCINNNNLLEFRKNNLNNEFIKIEIINGYTTESQKISFYGRKQQVIDNGVLVFEISHFLLGSDYIGEVSISHMYVYSEIINNLFCARKGVGINDKHELELKEVYLVNN